MSVHLHLFAAQLHPQHTQHHSPERTDGHRKSGKSVSISTDVCTISYAEDSPSSSPAVKRREPVQGPVTNGVPTPASNETAEPSLRAHSIGDFELQLGKVLGMSTDLTHFFLLEMEVAVPLKESAFLFFELKMWWGFVLDACHQIELLSDSFTAFSKDTVVCLEWSREGGGGVLLRKMILLPWPVVMTDQSISHVFFQGLSLLHDIGVTTQGSTGFQSVFVECSVLLLQPIHCRMTFTSQNTEALIALVNERSHERSEIGAICNISPLCCSAEQSSAGCTVQVGMNRHGELVSVCRWQLQHRSAKPGTIREGLLPGVGRRLRQVRV